MIPPGRLREDHRRGLRRYMEHGRLADRRPPGRAHGDARRRQHVPRGAGGDAPRPPRPGALLRLPARRHRAPPGGARAAGDGRGAGRAAPGGHGGGRRGRARAALRPGRRGGRPRARRRHRQHPALQRRRDGVGHGRVERGRRDDPGRHHAGPRRRHDRPDDLAHPPPGALRQPRRQDRQPGRPAALDRDQGGRRRARVRRRRPVGRGDHLQRRRPLPARGGVPGRRLRRPRGPGHRQRARARGAGRLAHAHRRGQRRRAPTPGAQPPRRRPAAARRDVAGACAWRLAA